MCLRKIKTYFWDSVKRNRVIRGNRTRISKSSFSSQGVEKQDFDGLLWGPVVFRVLFGLNGLGLWPIDPIRGCGHIRGWSTKVEVEMALQEELKVVYDRPKLVRGEKLPQSIYPRWFETFLTSWILF